MIIYLLDINKEMTDAWSRYFDDLPDVFVINQDFAAFMDDHLDIGAVVSPANSFGLMDGGYDKAIIDYFGKDLMKEVQKKIMLKWRGLQPVGTSMSVPIWNRTYNALLSTKICKLIHTPTMLTPEAIKDSRIVYHCMRAALIESLRQDVNSIVIPAFGGATGRVSCDRIAKLMYLAYMQVCHPPKDLNWSYALFTAKELRE